MTEIKVIRKNGKIVKYFATGHSGFNEHGYDIVCAALSTALQIPLVGFQEVLDIYPRFEINPDGFLCVDLEGMNLLEKQKEVSTLLETMLVFLKELTKQYPKNITLVEKEEI